MMRSKTPKQSPDFEQLRYVRLLLYALRGVGPYWPEARNDCMRDFLPKRPS